MEVAVGFQPRGQGFKSLHSLQKKNQQGNKMEVLVVVAGLALLGLGHVSGLYTNMCDSVCK